MSLKSLPLIFLTLSILVSLSAASLGGFQPIDNPNDPKIIGIGKFAVAEHNKKAGSALAFASVVRGEYQVVAGIKYKLVVAVKVDIGSTLVKNYEAIVVEQTWKKIRELVSFQEIKG